MPQDNDFKGKLNKNPIFNTSLTQRVTPPLQSAGIIGVTLRGERGGFFEVTFCIAMQNRRAVASYLHPQTIISQRSEYIIVSRSGGENSYLSVSNAGACTGLESEAPQGLSPDLVMYATLVSQGPNGQYVFIVEQCVPDGLEVKGTFIGGDGYFALEFSGASVSLTGAARFKPGPRTSAASPHCFLLGENAPGATVHFSAEYVPWQDEMLPRGFEGESVRATY